MACRSPKQQRKLLCHRSCPEPPASCTPAKKCLRFVTECVDLVLLWEGHLPACASLTLLLVPTTGSALSNDTHSIYYLRQRSFLFKKKGGGGERDGMLAWQGAAEPHCQPQGRELPDLGYAVESAEAVLQINANACTLPSPASSLPRF